MIMQQNFCSGAVSTSFLHRYDSLRCIEGVGPKTVEEFKLIDIETVDDLLFLQPK